MKEKKRVLVLIILSISFLIIGIIARINSIKELSEKEEPAKCNEKSYHLVSYSYIEEKEKSIFITSEKEFDKEKRLNKKDKKYLNFEEYDYLIYFIEPQNGCDREKRLKCVEYNDSGIKLNFEYNYIDDKCEVIFHDALIVELEKNKYDKSITVEETVVEVKNEED